jgi:hypothetical protein
MVAPNENRKAHAMKILMESGRDESKGSLPEDLKNLKEITLVSVLPFVDFLLHYLHLNLSLYRLPTGGTPPMPILPYPSPWPRRPYPPFPLAHSQIPHPLIGSLPTQ